MKEYSTPKMEIKDFSGEKITLMSGVNTLEDWKTTSGGTILSERNFQEMKDLVKITL